MAASPIALDNGSSMPPQDKWDAPHEGGPVDAVGDTDAEEVQNRAANQDFGLDGLSVMRQPSSPPPTGGGGGAEDYVRTDSVGADAGSGDKSDGTYRGEKQIKVLVLVLSLFSLSTSIHLPLYLFYVLFFLLLYSGRYLSYLRRWKTGLARRRGSLLLISCLGCVQICWMCRRWTTALCMVSKWVCALQR